MLNCTSLTGDQLKGDLKRTVDQMEDALDKGNYKIVVALVTQANRLVSELQESGKLGQVNHSMVKLEEQMRRIENIFASPRRRRDVENPEDEENEFPRPRREVKYFRTQQDRWEHNPRANFARRNKRRRGKRTKYIADVD